MIAEEIINARSVQVLSQPYHCHPLVCGGVFSIECTLEWHESGHQGPASF
jgi:hypothetical protein